jgi:hypothetical protein
MRRAEVSARGSKGKGWRDHERGVEGEGGRREVRV